MVLLMLTLLISCGAEEDSHPAPEEGGVTFTDDLGRQVTVPAAPQRGSGADRELCGRVVPGGGTGDASRCRRGQLDPV